MVVLSLLVAALLAPALARPADAPVSRLAARQNSGFGYGGDKIRGVNLGGWLVLEPWITPSLFEATGNSDIIDEYTFGQFQDRGRAQSALNNHWNSWITEDDFAQIAGAGLNHVRIPIGYWAYDVSRGEPYIQGQAEFLDRAIGWARNHGLKVMIDLHGAPGSQNGFDNSGQRGSANWPWDRSNVDRTKDVIERLSAKYSTSEYAGVVTSIALLNEPAGFYGDAFVSVTRDYFLNSYYAARYPWRNSDQSNLFLAISDAFLPLSSWNGFLEGQQVGLDTHHYQVFSPAEVQRSWPEHLQAVCSLSGEYSSSPMTLLVGEWSLATTDCAKWLNGRNRGSRYEGQYDGSPYVGSCNDKTGSGDNFSDDYKGFLRQFWDIQTQTYERSANGWIFWTWKNENAAEWSYKTGVEKGWIPRDPGNHVTAWESVCN